MELDKKHTPIVCKALCDEKRVRIVMRITDKIVNQVSGRFRMPYWVNQI